MIKKIIFPVVDAKGKPLNRQWKNVQAVLDYMGVTARYNILSKEIEVVQDKKWENILADIHSYAPEIREVCIRKGLKISSCVLASLIRVIAHNNEYSPVRDYLNSIYSFYKDFIDLERGENIDTLFSCLKTKGLPADKGLYKILLTKWLIGAYKIAFNQGDENCEGVLVLQGKQGIGKSRFLHSLSPDDNWFNNEAIIKNMRAREIANATGYWISNLSGSVGHIFRPFLTDRSDTYRLPYKKQLVDYPRLTAFVSTINQPKYISNYPNDRRYWTIPVEAIENLEKVNINKVWAEVAYKVLIKDEKHWLSDAEVEALHTVNVRFMKGR